LLSLQEEGRGRDREHTALDHLGLCRLMLSIMVSTKLTTVFLPWSICFEIKILHTAYYTIFSTYDQSLL